MTAKNLYAYTLEPVAYEISEEEQRYAQLVLSRSNFKIGKKAWLIMGAILTLALLGLIFIKNYSTVFCWVAIVCVVIYFLVRKFGIEWYAKRKLNEVPVQEIKGIRMGVQPHGISMQQRMGANMGTMTVGWKDIHEWYDTKDFILLNFKVKGQDGAYILPKRMDSKKFPFSTIRKHLNETVGPAKAI
ncbi:YcxB family protein [Acinetobacter sp. YH12128]|uniref:YcxB family protein n=1 Tax=Acinetobacter sp. YH12128 TaxID=2601113 RepID=UPI0015D33DDE|nr:YcxB family protein [Acinetobacter sp. YH12128]